MTPLGKALLNHSCMKLSALPSDSIWSWCFGFLLVFPCVSSVSFSNCFLIHHNKTLLLILAWTGRDIQPWRETISKFPFSGNLLATCLKATWAISVAYVNWPWEETCLFPLLLFVQLNFPFKMHLSSLFCLPNLLLHICVWIQAELFSEYQFKSWKHSISSFPLGRHF